MVLERAATPDGELVLRRRGEHVELILDGHFAMDSRGGRSERALVREALAGLERADVLIGGLGLGFSVDEALAQPFVERVDVVEIQVALVRWAGTHLRRLTERGLDDPRVRVVVGDVLAHVAGDGPMYDAICLDVDNGPGWLLRPANAALYRPAGLALARRRLRAGGRLAIWSAAAAPALEGALRDVFASVRAVPVPVPRGEPDLVYVAG